MINIIELAKQCNCNHVTIRKWVKSNNIETFKTKSSNGKMVQSLTENDANKFLNYWKEATSLPDNVITIPDLARKNNVDRKTIRDWARRNNIALPTVKNSNGPPCQVITTDKANMFEEEYNNSNSIAVQDILKEFNTDWRVVERWATNNSVKFVKLKSNQGGRSNFALNKNDYKKLTKHLEHLKLDGWFYMIQPVPEFNLNRIKLGFTKKPERRLKEHRGVCPNAKIVKKWKCHKDDEAKIRNAVTQSGCQQLYTEVGNHKTQTEVFDCDDYKEVLRRLEERFK